MNFLKDRLMPWWETGLIKWSAFLIGIAAGAHWSNVFAPYAATLAALGIVIGIIAGYFWSKE